MYKVWKKEFKGKQLVIENGKVAKQADGAFVVNYGESTVLVTAVMEKNAKEGLDFFPLTVEFQEKFYAAGKIPGGFVKREGKPSESGILSARDIDRPIRPLFPEDFKMPVQIVATILSVDPQTPPNTWGILGASLALNASVIPFNGIVAGVRIAYVDGKYVFFPSEEIAKDAELDLIVAGTKDAITMVEGEANEVSEELMVQTLMEAHEGIKALIAFEEEILSEFKFDKFQYEKHQLDQDLKERFLNRISNEELEKRLLTSGKHQRDKAIEDYKKEIIDPLLEESEISSEVLDETKYLLSETFEGLVKQSMRRMIFEKHLRVDGRDPDTIRPITCELGLLPRTHGSALFTRGETQSLGIVTLGASMDVQIIDTLLEEGEKRFMLHYNFPPFSVGETGRFGSPGRREIGHGHLAERALKRMIPPESEFPYTVRVVSEILESNGSSSMATVCSGSLSLMDAGVPAKKHVAGVAMGLIFEPDGWLVLTDITGMEDHLGDMDFKVAGTRDGITAFQMDVKVGHVSADILKVALDKAKKARYRILDIMYDTIPQSREHLSKYAPVIKLTSVPVDKIGELIGPGGKNVKALSEEYNVEIQIEENGSVKIVGNDVENVNKAMTYMANMSKEIKQGERFMATVSRVEKYGFFAEIVPGRTGLVHISKMGRRVKNVADVVHIGDKVNVEITGFDPSGKLQLRQIIEDGEDQTNEGEDEVRDHDKRRWNNGGEDKRQDHDR